MENTLIVYTSDHGEMLGDHGLWLKNVLLENAARVPLILAGPGSPHGKTVDTPVSHADLVATLVDLAGAPAARGAIPWFPLAHGQPGDHPGYALCVSAVKVSCNMPRRSEAQPR